jgi:hypothetical protein
MSASLTHSFSCEGMNNGITPPRQVNTIADICNHSICATVAVAIIVAPIKEQAAETLFQNGAVGLLMFFIIA